MATNNINDEVIHELNKALAVAEIAYASGVKPQAPISERLHHALDVLSSKAHIASAVFTNIITCLAIKAARSKVDIRYHQVQIQEQTDRPAGFNFRGVSEDAVYPWLAQNRFNGAQSGWQTRTLERPYPYNMSYVENISHVKQEFLTVFDEIEEHNQSATNALLHAIYLQIERRETLAITLSIPKTQEIYAIVQLFANHFFANYKGVKGASRLPVLALHAVYSVMVHELKRFEGCTLKDLEEHSAADAQTGSVGDIEVIDSTGHIFEALEIKHGILITEKILAEVQTKVMDKSIARYYVLTTHQNCVPDDGAKKIIRNIRSVYNCQVIANGVLSTIGYYLRLLKDPSLVFPAYVELLKSDKAIAFEHRTAWNKIVSDL